MILLIFSAALNLTALAALAWLALKLTRTAGIHSLAWLVSCLLLELFLGVLFYFVQSELIGSLQETPSLSHSIELFSQLSTLLDSVSYILLGGLIVSDLANFAVFKTQAQDKFLNFIASFARHHVKVGVTILGLVLLRQVLSVAFLMSAR